MMWQERAKCWGDDPERFTLDDGPHEVPPRYRAGVARDLCDGCPVIRECAADALRYRVTSTVRAGVWCGSANHSMKTSAKAAMKEIADGRRH